MKQLRLYWGENYSPKNKAMVKRINKVLNNSLEKINLYPGGRYDKTVQLIAKYHEVNFQQILLGNGIEGLIHIIVRSLVKKNTKVAILSPSFTVYKNAVINYGGKVIPVPVKIKQLLDVKNVLEKIKDTSLFFLASPNNPTGHYVFNGKQIDSLLFRYKGLLVVDECYFGIGKKTVINLLKKYKNLIILRSFSKSQGLAGIRFGYAMANPYIINSLEKYSYDIDTDSINIFQHALIPIILKYADTLSKQYLIFKKSFCLKLTKQIPMIEILPSLTTFILVKTNKESKRVFNAFKKNNILLKDTRFFPNFPKNVIMFAVPRKEDWSYFIKTLKQALA